MNSIERYIAFLLFRYFAVTALGFGLFAAFVKSKQLFDLITDYGINLVTFGSLLFLFLPILLSLIIPASLLIAVIWLFWRLADDNELVALRGAGLSYWGLLKAPILVSILVSIFLYLLLFYVNPLTRDYYSKLQLSAQSKFSISLIQEGQFNSLSDDITLYVKEVDDNFLFREIFIYDGRVGDDGSNYGITIIADEGQLYENPEGFRLEARNGSYQTIEEGRLHSISFDEYSVNWDTQGTHLQCLSKASDISSFDLVRILFVSSSETYDDSYLSSLWSEFHNRLAFPLLSPLFCLFACYIMLCCRPFSLPVFGWNLPIFPPKFFSVVCAILFFLLYVSLVNSIEKNLNNAWFIYSFIFSGFGFFIFMFARKNNAS